MIDNSWPHLFLAVVFVDIVDLRQMFDESVESDERLFLIDEPGDIGADVPSPRSRLNKKCYINEVFFRN